VLVLPPFVIAAAMTRSTFLLEATKTGGQSSNWAAGAIFISLISWMSIARTVRGMVLSLREKEFVEAAPRAGRLDVPDRVQAHPAQHHRRDHRQHHGHHRAGGAARGGAVVRRARCAAARHLAGGLLINQNKNDL